MVLVIFDIESTGLDRSKDCIIQFAGLKIDTDTQKVISSYNTYIQPIGDYSISPGAYFKHHITKDFLADKPTMPQVAPSIVDFFKDAENVLTYNGNSFDIPFLKNELNKYGFDIDFMSLNCYDAFIEERKRNGVNLENTYKRYKGMTMEEAGLQAHDAFSDIKATYTVFVAQQHIEGYGPQKMYGEDNVITDMVFEDEVKPCFNIGKYKGVSIDLVAIKDQGYLRWCVSDRCNFMESTKKYIKQFIR